MILKVKDENGQFKEVVLKGLKGEKGDRGEDGTVLQQKEIDDIKSSLDTIIQKNDSYRVNVKYPPMGYIGAKGDGVTNDTEAIQKLINDFYHIEIPKGVYLIDKLELMPKTKIEGCGDDTVLKANNSSEIGFICISNNPIYDVHMSNMYIEGNGVNQQHGLYFKATPHKDSPYHGGLWLSTFKNLTIKNFRYGQISLLSGSNALLPNQGLVFERVETRVANYPDSIALLIEGQTEQVLWNQCAFSGENIANNVVVFRRERGMNNESIGDIGGNGQTFIQCYVGCGKTGISLERSFNIKFNNMYFETLNKCINLKTVCENIIISGSEFRTCSIYNDDDYILNAENICSFILENNKIIGTVRNFVQGWGNGIIRNNESYNFLVENEEIDSGIDNGTLNVRSKSIRTAGTITNISCLGYTRERIILKAWGREIVLNGDGNISTPTTIPQGHYAILEPLQGRWVITYKSY